MVRVALIVAYSSQRRASDGCNNHIGMGVRYNAEKKKIGNYFSTPIYSFRCKCHLCDNWFTIETDPKVSQSADIAHFAYLS